MKYFVLELRSKEEKDMDLKGTTYDMNQNVVEEIFYAGESLKNKVQSPLTVILNDRRTTYSQTLFDRIAIDTNQTGAVLLVSSKAQEVLRKLSLPIEFIDVTIKGKNLELKDYKFVNIIGRINCTDHEKSELEYLEENVIQLYDTLVLNESKIPDGTDIFLLGEDITMVVIISERVKNAIEAAKLTGFEIKKPEDFKTFR